MTKIACRSCQDETMRWALRFCILGHRSMDVPKKHSLEAMLALLADFLREGAGR